MIRCDLSSLRGVAVDKIEQLLHTAQRKRSPLTNGFDQPPLSRGLNAKTALGHPCSVEESLDMAEQLSVGWCFHNAQKLVR